MSKYQVGDTVRINGKDGASSSLIGRVTKVTRVESCGAHPYTLEGQWESFCEQELDLVKRKSTMNTRRTFKLLKDTPEVRKGALFQEACDDGDQEYILLDHSFIIPEDYFDFYSNISFSRDTVEKQPAFFEEVEMHWLPKVARAVKKVTKKRK